VADSPEVPRPEAPAPVPVARAAEVPMIQKPDFQMLLQDNAQLRRDFYEDRRHFERRLADERERGRWEIERVRSEYQAKLTQTSRENDALIMALGRLRQENDQLREENCMLKLTRANGHEAPQAPMAPLARTEPGSPVKVPVIPSFEPLLGKKVPLTEQQK
jgi:hypothetical protein